MDRQKAMEKMRAFQLSNPYAYCLKWVQAAVAARATHFTCHSDPQKVRVRIFGAGLNPERLPVLPSLMLDGQANAMEKHLASGIQSVIQTKARKLTIASWDGNSGSVVHWEAGRHEQQPWEPQPLPQVLIELTRTARDRWQEWWYAANHHHVGEARGSPRARDREQQLLHERAALAPLKILVEEIQPEFELRATPSPASQLRSLLSLRNPYGFRSAESLPAQRGGFQLHKNSQFNPGYRHRIFVATPNCPPNFSMLYLIREGVLLETATILQGWPGKVFIACADELKTDLSGLRVVYDERWEALREELQTYVMGGE